MRFIKMKKYRFGNLISKGNSSENIALLLVVDSGVFWMPSFYDSHFVVLRAVRSLK